MNMVLDGTGRMKVTGFVEDVRELNEDEDDLRGVCWSKGCSGEDEC